MRLKGIALVTALLLARVSLAQVSGTVDAIGFQNYYRPDCWTPMLVTVVAQTSQTATYQIHVKLTDLDRDLPIFERSISVTGASEGSSRQQQFRMYFMPPPTDGGLPDSTDSSMTTKDLQARLKVSLHTSSGKWICDLPVTTTITNLDPKPGAWSQRRGEKLILAVNDEHRPVYRDNTGAPLLGVVEDATWVNVHPRDLPENVLGYDAVDAIVWFDSDPAELRAGGDERYRALEAYVRRGGTFVISQPAEWQKTLGFGETLLPVEIEGVDQKPDLQPLRELAKPPDTVASLLPENSVLRDPFKGAKSPARVARAKAKVNSIVDESVDWSDGRKTPYIVRAPLGLGSITWVAQDLGDPTLTRVKYGWTYVWQRVLDLKGTPLPVSDSIPGKLKDAYAPGFAMDLGKSMLGGMDLGARSLGLISVAILFFIVYWVVAGPGAYALLASKKRTHLSWFAFGAAALVATGFTVVIVKLVLRGPPQVAHFSIVRVAPDQPAEVISRLGIYIPRDGLQTIELKDAAPETVSSITALPIHPFFLSNVPDQSGPEYYVPVNDATSGVPASLAVPYRSTLKKFRATWSGEISTPQASGKILGNPKLEEQGWISGKLTNDTGHTLVAAYVAFKYPGEESSGGGDWMLYIPEWGAGSSIDLADAFNGRDETGTQRVQFVGSDNPPGGRRVRGRIDREWEQYWLDFVLGPGGGANHAAPISDTFDDSGKQRRQSIPILSFFDRLKPAANIAGLNTGRIEFLRRGARDMDVSPALSAGSLVILGPTQADLPVPLEIDGGRASGDGTVLYQFVLPLDRSAVDQTKAPDQTGSTTRPTTSENR